MFLRSLDLENLGQIFVWARDHLNTYDFANATSSRCTSVCGSFDSGYVPGYESGNQSAANLVPAQKLHLAAFIMASTASTKEMNPLVSIIPSASEILAILDFLLAFGI